MVKIKWKQRSKLRREVEWLDGGLKTTVSLWGVGSIIAGVFSLDQRASFNCKGMICLRSLAVENNKKQRGCKWKLGWGWGLRWGVALAAWFLLSSPWPCGLVSSFFPMASVCVIYCQVSGRVARVMNTGARILPPSGFKLDQPPPKTPSPKIPWPGLPCSLRYEGNQPCASILGYIWEVGAHAHSILKKIPTPERGRKLIKLSCFEPGNSSDFLTPE